MDTIIGLGSAGCKIADEFSKYPQYKTLKIDIGLTGSNCFSFEARHNPENYEKNVPDMSAFFKDVTGDLLFVLGGGGKISGATLQILKQLKNCNINILYIKSQTKSLTKMGELQDRLTFNVLQEYTRSGVFNRMFMIYNPTIENFIGDVPIFEFYKKMNEVIVTSFHYYNIFTHTQSVVQNIESPKEIQRISTIGIFNLLDKTETIFFPLQNIGHKCYYYGIPESVLKSDGKLFKLVKEKASQEQTSYEIHTTKHEQPFSCFVANSSYIQALDNL